jgi:hypothetical protein
LPDIAPNVWPELRLFPHEGRPALEFFKRLFSSDFLPHGTCYLWNPRIVWLHVVSDSVITLSYYCIPLALVYLVRKRRDIPFNWIFWMFGLFILGCGTTHLMEVWTVWHPTYLLSGVIKAITAAVSIATAMMLIPLVPKVISLPSRMHLQELNLKLEQKADRRRKSEDAVRESLYARDRSDPRLVKQMGYFASAAAIFSMVVGLSGLVGWALHISSLTNWGAAPATMKANSAACFVLMGISLWVINRDNQPSTWARNLAGISPAIIVGLVGLLSLVEHVLRLDLGLDQLLLVAAPEMETVSVRAGLMSPLTAGAFLMLSLASLGIDWRTRQGWRPGQIFSLSAGIAAIFGVLSFAFDPHIYAAHLSLSLPTAVTLAVLSLGLVSARTKWGMGGLLCSKSLGGDLTRRLLPAAFIPVLVGWIRWRITATGLYSEWSIVVLASMVTLSLLAGLIAWAAVVVDRNDVERKLAEVDVKESLATREAAL